MTRPGLRNPFSKRSPAARPRVELPIPAHFRCPISLDLMKDPVTLSTGITYDRQSIETWLERGNWTCPVTNQMVNDEELIPNHSIRRMIQDWCVANRSYGIERIPTPKIPVTSAQVSDILSEMGSASRHGDRARCRELVAKIKTLAKENERNRRCIVSSGAGRALCISFNTLARKFVDSSSNGVLEEILSVLNAGLFPLDEEACWQMGSPESLKSIVSILKAGDLAGRLNAVLVLKEVVANTQGRIEAVAETEGLIESLVKLIKEPISPQTTKASLVASFYLVSSDEKTASKFVELGLVSLLLELLVDSEKSMCEKALAVLDAIFGSEKGRDKAFQHALSMPVLVKKMFRVSDMATEFAVSALWKLCKNNDARGMECLLEALQVGAFQKLLLLLQVGCSEATKEKATDLLKLLNGYRGKLECTETADFKGLKRPF